jgi:hypothetical protein
MILRIEYLENLLYKQYIIDHPELGDLQENIQVILGN